MSFKRYGVEWPDGTSTALIERQVLRAGGTSLGLFQHYKNYIEALWPEHTSNRWTDLMLREILEHQFSAVMGPGSSFKTSTLAKIALADWSLFPECTTILVSSTTIKELKQRIFGEIVKLWEMADNRHGGDGWWPGIPLDYLTAIAYDDIEEKRVRDIRNGIIGVACVSSEGRQQGMGKFAGKKNRRVWCINDELQFCERGVLDAQENLISNGENLVSGIYPDDYPDPSERRMPRRGYKAVFIGNSNNTRPENALHMVMSPPGGWGTFEFDGKTKVYNAARTAGTCIQCRCIILDGLDSPNNDYPGETPRFPQLISKQRLSKYAPESEGYYSQGRGIVKLGLAGLKIITVELCDQFNAFDKDCIWDEETTKIGMLDAAYGGVGGDRCTAGALEFGKCLDGTQRIKLMHSIEVPVKMNPKKIPEDQIAEFCRDYWIKLNVPPENVFFDGRGRLALSFAQKWSPFVNVVDFGGRPSERPAGPDLFIEDRLTGRRRRKLAHEHFSKFVSELWWAVAFTVQGGQMRGLTRQIVEDGQPREWYKVKGDKVEIETKAEMKKRTGCSPDWADCLVCGVEGARQKGFVIASVASPEFRKSRVDPLAKLAEEWQQLQEDKLAMR